MIIPTSWDHLYVNNYLPVTRYDETTGVQFVDQLMYTKTKRMNP